VSLDATEPQVPRDDARTAPPDAAGRPGAGAEVIRLEDVRKRYGHTIALAGANVDVREGEVMSIVGHNGAGKSTLVRVLCGLTQPQEGRIHVRGDDATASHSFATARRAGIRIAFQEFSLSPSLRVFENVLVAHAELAGWGWRKRAAAAIKRQLDEIFPGHGISARARVASLSLAERQMLEIARAAMPAGAPVRLLILDEPNSALGAHASEQLFAWVRRQREQGMGTILISHRLREVVAYSDRIVVMRDGAVVDDRPAAGTTREQIVDLMGQAMHEAAAASAPARTRLRALEPLADEGPALELRGLRLGGPRPIDLTVGAGEIVGLAGLDGQGQRELLAELWRLRHRRRSAVHARGGLAFVSGDRQEAGLFKLWPITENVSLSALGDVSSGGLVRLGAERELAQGWAERLKVRGRLSDPVTDLSGGTQQKAVVARALASDARIVLLDDPFRGVDSGTKRDTYQLIHDEAARGRSFVWFTTENDELQECDRVYVLRNRVVVAELRAEEIREDRIVAASFADEAETRGAAS